MVTTVNQTEALSAEAGAVTYHDVRAVALTICGGQIDQRLQAVDTETAEAAGLQVGADIGRIAHVHIHVKQVGGVREEAVLHRFERRGQDDLLQLGQRLDVGGMQRVNSGID